MLQVILNQEIMRYTLATGEPIFTGILRTRPGPAFWGPVYSLLLFLQIGWPGWALSAATAIAAAFLGRMPGEADKSLIVMCGYATFLVSMVIMMLGKKVEKTLEWAEWFMIAWILLFMLIVGLFFTSGATWGKVTLGFLGLGGRPIPQSGDWVLLASFAAFAGMGGLGNGTISNWVRDKGWGMGATVGHIAGLVGGRKVPLSRVGNVFPRTEENRRRFMEWMRYVRFEQAWIFGAGCFLGMGLPALMTVQFVPPGANITGDWGTAVYQAQGLGRAFGQAAWFLTLLNGFWILFSTQLGNIDIFARTVTDMLWSAHPRIQQAAQHDVRRVYFSAMVVFAAFGMGAMNLARPGVLIIVSAFIATFNFVILGTHLLVVQRKFLPPELRMSKGREAAIYLFIAMFVVFAFLGVQSKWGDIMRMLGRV